MEACHGASCLIKTNVSQCTIAINKRSAHGLRPEAGKGENAVSWKTTWRYPNDHSGMPTTQVPDELPNLPTRTFCVSPQQLFDHSP